MNKPGHRRVLGRDWGPESTVRTRQLAILKRIKILGGYQRRAMERQKLRLPN